MKNRDNNKLLFYIGIPVIFLLIILRFVISYIRSDGFNGLSLMLPIQLLCVMIFAFCSSVFFAMWVYQDCKKRGDDAVLWSIVVFLVTPFIGLLVYFLHRSEIKTICPDCGHRISVRANYCEECGTQMKKEENMNMEKQGTHHIELIVANVVSIVLMIVCLIGAVMKIASGSGINTDAASRDRVWNTGIIRMNYSSSRDNVWKLDFRSASDGFVKEQTMTIDDADTQMLYADISCGTVPEGATLVLWLVQGDTAQSVDVTNLSEPLEYALNEFENGKIRIRLQINGVENTVSEIYIQ